MVDAWESLQDEYQRTAVVLDHFDEELNAGSGGGVTLSNGSKRKIRIMLLAGGDLIQSMGEPGVWADVDVSFLLLLLSPTLIPLSISSAKSHPWQVWLHDRRKNRSRCLVIFAISRFTLAVSKEPQDCETDNLQ